MAASPLLLPASEPVVQAWQGLQTGMKLLPNPPGKQTWRVKACRALAGPAPGCCVPQGPTWRSASTSASTQHSCSITTSAAEASLLRHGGWNGGSAWVNAWIML